jgi:hypothetical protein
MSDSTTIGPVRSEYRFQGASEMKTNTTRRGFVGAAAGLAGIFAASAAAEINNTAGGFKLGIATWSLRDFQRPLVIEMIKQLQTPYVSVKEFHLLYSSMAAEFAAGRKQFESAVCKSLVAEISRWLKTKMPICASISNMRRRAVCP